MKVEIWSDVACPFCYIGKRRFEEALQRFPHKDSVEVEWKSFQLNPGLRPEPGKSVERYLSEVKGISEEQAANMNRQVTLMAAEAGLDYHLDRCILANTSDAHRLIQYAKTLGKGDETEEVLFRAYFTEGKDTGSHMVLTELAVSAGLDKEAVLEILATDRFSDAVELDAYEANQLGIRGVPFFVFDRKYGISGAQPSEVFDRTFLQAYTEASAGGH